MFARVTERSALAGARWLGRADKEAAEEAAFSGARIALERMPIDGQRRDRRAPRKPSSWPPARSIGAGGEEYDLALDPLEGRAVVARGGTNAISMIAASPRGSMPSLPDMYMRKMAVGPRARGADLAPAPGRRQRALDRRGVRPHGQRRDRDRARPAAAPRSDRGDPRLGRTHQADPGRRRDRVDQRGGARHERPPRDRHRRHATSCARGDGAALPRRRAAGAAVADAARGDRGARERTGSTTSSGSSRSTTSRRRR